MKTTNTLLIAGLLLALAGASCKKSTAPKPAGKLGTTYPEPLNAIVTPDIIDTFRSHGMTINDGTTPPVVNGIYLLAPDECFYDNSSANAGTIFTSYQYQFSNQDNTTYALTVNYNNAVGGGSDSGTDGSATYISGNNQLFTVFAQVTGTLGGVTYKELQVLSGQLQTGGIKDFQWGYLMVSKSSDPGDKAVVPVGTIRLFKDEDGSSETQTTIILNSIKQKLTQNAARPEFRSLVAASK